MRDKEAQGRRRRTRPVALRVFAETIAILLVVGLFAGWRAKPAHRNPPAKAGATTRPPTSSATRESTATSQPRKCRESATFFAAQDVPPSFAGAVFSAWRVDSNQNVGQRVILCVSSVAQVTLKGTGDIGCVSKTKTALGVGTRVYADPPVRHDSGGLQDEVLYAVRDSDRPIDCVASETARKASLEGDWSVNSAPKLNGSGKVVVELARVLAITTESVVLKCQPYIWVDDSWVRSVQNYDSVFVSASHIARVSNTGHLEACK